ncbi:MAG: signal peptide peptidase SppA [Leadbetterella sp.]|nr:signal peptide peptidase SppA [Leadbetterella sp.]
MLQFLKYVLATIIGLCLFVVISFFVMAGIGSMLSSSDSVTTVKEKSVLKLNFDSYFTELTIPEDPFSDMFGDGTPNIGLNDFKSALANAAKDPNIKGISISLSNPMLGFGEMAEVKAALKDFKKSGKFIYTYSEFLSEKAVLLAAVADSSFLHPLGGVEFNGLSSEVTFIKGTLDKLGLEPLVFRVGEFKSAVEPFIRTDMSAESKEQVSQYIGSIAGNIYTDFAADKKMTKEEVDGILNKASMLSADESTANRLISAQAYQDQYEDALRRKLGLKADAKISYVSLSNYTKAKKYVPEGKSENRIAVIVSEGEIVQGHGNENVIGSDDFVKEIRKARKDKKIKAVVLRINSPGGSALASDIMWREIQLTRKEKPVIASMGDVAASGGYYMAMGCDTIVAHPTTITGSIGIFGLMLNSQKLMNEKLGVTFDGVKTHEFADSPSLTRKMSDAEKQTIQNMVNDGYETFTSKAAQGRKMSIEKLKAVAGGRVWTGEQAKAHGLVDVLGGLDEAVAIAAKKVNLKEGDFQVKYYPYPKSELDRIIERFSKKQEDARMAAYLGELAPVYRQLLSVKNMDRIQARLMFVPEFR